MTIEIYEIFDAPTEVLVQEHKAVQLALPNSHGAEHARLQVLRDTIQQELQERRSSQSLLKELLPIIEGANPDTWLQNAPVLLSAASNAPAALQEELRQLVAAGQRIAALRNPALQAGPLQTPAVEPLAPGLPALNNSSQPQRASSALPSTSEALASASSSQGKDQPPASAIAAVNHQGVAIHDEDMHRLEQQQVDAHQEPQHDVQGPGPPAEQQQDPSAVGAADDAVQTDIDLQPEISAASDQASSKTAGKASKGPPMTAQDAALAAFREEQRKLHKARKALLGGGEASHKAPPAPAAPAHARPRHTVQDPSHQPTRSPAPPKPSQASTTCESLGTQSGQQSSRQEGGNGSPSPAHSSKKAPSKKPASAGAAPAEATPTEKPHKAGLAHADPLKQFNPPEEGRPDVVSTTAQDQEHVASSTHEREAQGNLVAGLHDSSASPVQLESTACITRGALDATVPRNSLDASLPASQPETHHVTAVHDSSSTVTASLDAPATQASHRRLHVDIAAPPAGGQSVPEVEHEVHEPVLSSSPSAASTYDYESDTLGTPYPDQSPPASVRAARRHVVVQASAGGAQEVTAGGGVSKVPAGQLQTDKWADWELELGSGTAWGVSAWGREAQEDPVACHLRAMKAMPKMSQQQPPGAVNEQAGTRKPGSIAADAGVVASASGGGALLRSCASVTTGAKSVPAPLPRVATLPASTSEASSPVRRPPPEGLVLAPPAGAEQGPMGPGLPGLEIQGVSVAGNTAAAPSVGSTAAGDGVPFARQGTVTRLLKPVLSYEPAQDEQSVQPAWAPSPPQPAPAEQPSPSPSPAPTPAPVASTNTSATTPPRRPQSAGTSQGSSGTMDKETTLQCIGGVYANCFYGFHEILSMCSTPTNPTLEAGPSQARAPSRQLVLYSAVELNDKYQGLMLRLGAWIDALARRDVAASNPKLSTQPAGMYEPGPGSGLCAGSRQGSGGGQLMRYFAIADDTLHPEVRQVVELALAGLPGWSSDPVDQITELGKPDPYPDDYLVPSNRTTPDPSTPSRGVYVQARSPLLGRCNMWNILWSWSLKVRAPLSDLLAWQRANHFPEAKQLTRKDLLARHVGRYQIMHGSNARLGPLFNCLPTTFTLPKEATSFQTAFTRASHGVEPSVTQPNGLNLWIVKPVGLSRGRGIRLIKSLREVSDGAFNPASVDEPQVVQRYVTNPLTIQGYKFDLRLYVLVTSFNPLEAWLCREGFARFASQAFSLEPDVLSNRLVHLTNSSVQKAAAAAGALPDFLKSAQTYGGSKCSLSRLQQLLAEQGVPWAAIWTRITDVLTACLFAAQDAIPACQNAFELFGADVLIDTHGAVWVLEINSSPSLSMDTPLDKELKPRIIRDAINIVDPLPFDRDALLEVLAARSSTKSRASRRPGGVSYMAGTAQEERQLLCADLQQILGGNVPRRYGEQPRVMASQDGQDPNWFACISPSPLVEKLAKLRKS